jgi:hypothetical protein
MRFGMKHYLVGLAILTLSLPVWARTYKQSVEIKKDAMIGSTQLKPGSYSLMADDAKKELEIKQGSKTVATVPGAWVKTPQKIRASSVDFDGDKITGVDFSGSEQVFQIQ